MGIDLEAERARVLGLILPEPTLTGPQCAERAGVTHELAQRVWLALGMPHVDETEVAFSDRDVEALRVVKTMLDAGYPLEDLVTVARLIGRAMGRITDATSRTIYERIVEPAIESGIEPSVLDDSLKLALDLAGPVLDYAYRRHMIAAITQMAPPEDPVRAELSCGFVDLVAFSRVSDDLQEDELGTMISRFEEMSMNACVESGVRLVKIVGDSAMFVSNDSDRALHAARAIIDLVMDDELLPAARAGLDAGPVLPQGGDYFGRPINVASRIATFARPGTIVCSGGFLESLRTPHPVTRIRARRLKNVGRVTLFKLYDPARGRRRG